MNAKDAEGLRNTPGLLSKWLAYRIVRKLAISNISKLTPDRTEKIEFYKKDVLNRFEALTVLASVRLFPDSHYPAPRERPSSAAG
jgi:hypothetical protein